MNKEAPGRNRLSSHIRDDGVLLPHQFVPIRMILCLRWILFGHQNLDPFLDVTTDVKREISVD